MSEFNGRNYYGFALHNDPALSTTTHNFEFRYTCPDQLERAIQKVQQQHRAEAAAAAADSKRREQAATRFCRVRGARDVYGVYKSSDRDVETHMSRSDGRRKRVRNLTSVDVDQTIELGKNHENLADMNVNDYVQNLTMSDENDSDSEIEIIDDDNGVVNDIGGGEDRCAGAVAAVAATGTEAADTAAVLNSVKAITTQEASNKAEQTERVCVVGNICSDTENTASEAPSCTIMSSNNRNSGSSSSSTSAVAYKFCISTIGAHGAEKIQPMSKAQLRNCKRGQKLLKMRKHDSKTSLLKQPPCVVSPSKPTTMVKMDACAGTGSIIVEDYIKPAPRWVQIVHSAVLGSKIEVDIPKPIQKTKLRRMPPLHVNITPRELNTDSESNIQVTNAQCMTKPLTLSESVDQLEAIQTQILTPTSQVMTAHGAAILEQKYIDYDRLKYSVDSVDECYQQQVGDCQVAPQPGYVEDSDLEFEIMNRVEYTKYCSPRPAELSTCQSIEQTTYPLFVEMEPDVPRLNLSYIKNTSPMRYTERTEDTQDTQEVEDSSEAKSLLKHNQLASSCVTVDEPTVIDNRSFRSASRPDQEKRKDKRNKVRSSPRSKSRKIQQQETTTSSPPNSARTAKRQPEKQRSPRPEGNRRMAKINSPKIAKAQSKGANTTPRTSAGGCPASTAVGTHTVSSVGIGGTVGKDVTPRRLKQKKVVYTRSLEDLKIEKMAIFQKMLMTHERIIDSLDKIRDSLLQLQAPEGTYEKSKRQKNAFEFCVRFSRNFLYPLKGMIDDLKYTPIDLLNSASSNEACARVSNIYSLLYQSLQTYYKQLRYFLLDKVPEKLSALIEAIYTTTNICLEKGIFDRQDPVIDCMQERCTKLLGFLEDMQEERWKLIREAARKAQADKKGFTLAHSNYDLKMFMNDLNMYEAKLVPKPKPTRPKRIGKKSVRKQPAAQQTEVTAAPSADLSPLRPCEYPVETQMQNLDKGKSFHGGLSSSAASATLVNDTTMAIAAAEIMPSTTHVPEPSVPVNSALIEALQLVTKDQLRQVLEPLIQSLGSMLDRKVVVQLVDAEHLNSNTEI